MKKIIEILFIAFLSILMKGNAISDDQIKILRDRGDIVSPKVLNNNP